MSESDSPSESEPRAAVPTASLEELTQLNDELAALARAGVAMEAGLGPLTGSKSRLAALAKETRDRLGRGESLADAVPVGDDALGRAYRTVVAAGVRSGRLAEGLEAFGRVGRVIVDHRRGMLLALAHPVIVLAVTYGFLSWFVFEMVPRWAFMYDDFGLEPPWPLRIARWAEQSLRPWWWAGPALLIALIVWTWLSGRSGRLGPLALIPFTGRSLREFRVATFCDLLALLVERGVPVPEALSLAGRASGDGSLAKATDGVAAEIIDGQDFANSIQSKRAIPQFARWMLVVGARDGALAASAEQTALVLRRRAVRRIGWIRTVVPVLVTVVLGGSAVLFYALLMWLPFTSLLNGLS